MIKFITLLVVLVSFEATACDVCGGVTAPNTQGLLPNNQYHFVGLRFGYNGFKSTHPLGLNHISTSTHEHFVRGSVLGKWQFTDRFDLQVDLPVIWNTQVAADSNRSNNGIGDASIFVNALAVNINDEKTGRSHFFKIGAGVKLPTGKYSKDAWETNNMFPGSGSVDFSIATNYVFSGKNLGILHENSVVIKTKNNVGYQYGNIYLTRFAGFYKKKFEAGIVMMPSIGASYIFSQTDRINDILVSSNFNNGHILNGDVGLNFISNNWMLSSNVSLPLFQFIGGGDVTSKGSVELGIFYLIPKK